MNKLNTINLFVLFIVMNLISGCSLQNNSDRNNQDVSSIKLECIQLCLRMNEKPFEEKQFKGLDSIALLCRLLLNRKK